jgi:hypothetical protein
MAIICIGLLLLLFFASRADDQAHERALREEELKLARLRYEVERAAISVQASAQSAVKITEEVSKKFK